MKGYVVVIIRRPLKGKKMRYTKLKYHSVVGDSVFIVWIRIMVNREDNLRLTKSSKIKFLLLVKDCLKHKESKNYEYS